jgi:UDP-N-acetylmuramate dehydrogenase
VGLSPKHTLVVINYQDSTAAEVIAFAKQVQGRVREKFGVLLEPEVQLVGFAPDELLLQK